ncbi:MULTISPECIES: hypothetical protein [unclassified Pseudomonas]|uniref:hypothetical protein n=1 Tax=unclassified Pseudomonas TaxID=196821 RepID=UPI000BCEE739|nr:MULTISPECIES: hypothetical protein [unclassified Pseudomonas]PVZ20711.1 hypothetical protein F474_01313 [Pseudomonas sp. URIL14HWK12:I12]PVZ27777.1 hypothetical protein F470_00968 [Pseudomonas sp. URIL14HWK12:I10]PVZ38666.1 hypothetical protein F472_01313 [Pseudomonas sp. URIL14HWK12:I11]SNZ02449.1 hypothetical protein SAMN05660463_00091 [Pseudomonas sp. URIL14HWK12:I9]
MTSLLLRYGATLGCAIALAGCANHLPQRSDQEARVERTLLAHDLRIDVGEPGNLDQPRRRVHVSEIHRYQVTDWLVTRRYDRYTPYQAWREAYEIPLGAVALVAGVGANVANVFALGHLPGSMTHGWISYGVAGINPFMNAPANGRAEQNLASVERTQTGQREETVNVPWANRTVEVTAGPKRYPLDTDAKGYLRIDLLESPFADQDLNQVTRLGFFAKDEDDQSQADAWLPLAPGLRGRLAQARALIYDDLEDDSVAQWVQRSKRLRQLGLPQEAEELEQSLIELTHNDPELQRDYLEALRRQR